jgi:hypothetical protein
MEDYCRIRVGAMQAGVVGLKAALAELAGRKERVPEEEVGALLRQKLARQNYFAPGAEPQYEEAFRREYRKYLGLPVAAAPGGLSLKLLGAGCPRCEKLRDEIIQLLSEEGRAADFEYVCEPLEVAPTGCSPCRPCWSTTSSKPPAGCRAGRS